MRQFPATLSRGCRRQERVSWTVALTVSTGIHALALAVLLQGGASPQRTGAPTWLFAELTENAAGGGEPAVVRLAWGSPVSRSTPAEPTSPTPVHVPELQLPEIAQVPPTDFSLEALEIERLVVAAPPLLPGPVFTGAGGASARGQGGGAGGGTGRGTGAGLGSGTGPGSGTPGEGIRPPAPLTILMPPAAIDAVRGGTAKVRLQVDSTGVVRAVDILLSSGDLGYDEQLRTVASGWRFRPARDAANRPVPYPFDVSVTF